ncbi:MAG: hypothetical protein ACRD0Y_03620, partial [Terriglobales bacterium]
EVRVGTAADPTGQDETVRSFGKEAELSTAGAHLLLDEETGGNSGRYSVYLRTLTGPEAGTVVRLGDGNALALSPDGRWALSLLPTSPPQLELLPTGAGEPRQLTHGLLSFLPAAAFLPDSAGILAVASAPGQPPRTYRISLNGSLTPMTPAGVFGAWPTPDGKSVLVRNSNHQWFLYPLAVGAQPAPVHTLSADDVPLGFGATSNQLFVTRIPSGPSAPVFRLNLHTGQRTQLATARAPEPAGVEGVAVQSISRDGKTFAFSYSLFPSTLYVVSGLH